MITSLKLRDIWRDYGDGEFSLTIDSLEFHNKNIHVIVGPNGSGKTSLLRLIALLDKPHKGKILFNEKAAASSNYSTGLRKKIGFVMQKPYLFDTDVVTNVAMGLRIRKYPRKESLRKAEDMLNILGIRHLAKRNVKDLSSGEYQKAAIAQVLVLNVEVILIDEPTANIDKQSTSSIEQTLKDIQKGSNSIIILSTHSLNQAYRISQDIVSIREGKVVPFLHENVFKGEIKNTYGGLQYINAARGIDITLSTEKIGKLYIAIDPQDIIVSSKFVKTSAKC